MMGIHRSHVTIIYPGHTAKRLSPGLPKSDSRHQYLKRVEYVNGCYRDVTRGIARGCPISPLLGALYLKTLDDVMARVDVFYVRYMDDWVI